MGLLIDGVWHEQESEAARADAAKTGRFERQDSAFRNWVTSDGRPGPTGSALPSPFKFQPYGKSGIEVSEIFSKTARHVDDLCSEHGSQPVQQRVGHVLLAVRVQDENTRRQHRCVRIQRERSR